MIAALGKQPTTKVPDPLQLQRLLWPDIRFTSKQKEIIYSVWNDDRTIVPAGNMLGKDFIGGFIATAFFITRHPCRIITTSAKDDHLRVLWGEIGRFIQTAKHPLDWRKGGPLICNHHDIYKVVNGSKCPLSYLRGMVANNETIASMQGHHIASTGDGVPRTLALIDECSSVSDEIYKMMVTWANRLLAVGNPWPCSNFFFKAVEGDQEFNIPGGDIPREGGEGYHRKVIHIAATDSPNVRYGLLEETAGKKPSNRVLIQGVKSYGQYKTDLVLMDLVQQCISLRGEFYKGAQLFLFPEEWLELAMARADAMADSIVGDKVQLLLMKLKAKSKVMGGRKTLGIDPAEGGDRTVWTPASMKGIITQHSIKTPDTSVVGGQTIGFMKEYNIAPEDTLFDRGGGGKEHADYLRSAGYNVRTVAFGESVAPELKKGLIPLEKRRLDAEERYSYKNRRAQMYGILSEVLNPANGLDFSIPRSCKELIRQLKAIPKLYDGEGRLWLPPKRKKDKDSKEKTMKDLIGCSPDEADSAVLAVYGLFKVTPKRSAGVMS